MSPKAAENTYLQSSVQSASPVRLTIMLYDRLVTDIRNASAAVQEDNIEKCCEHLNHAALVLGHLEGNLDHENGGDTAKSLAAFYSVLRAKLLEAQVKKSPEIFEEQIGLIVQVRQTWQKVEDDSRPAATPAANPGMFQAADDEAQSSGWSA